MTARFPACDRAGDAEAAPRDYVQRMTLTRRATLALLASAAALPAFGQAAPIPLDRISAYLNGIRTA